MRQPSRRECIAGIAALAVLAVAALRRGDQSTVELVSGSPSPDSGNFKFIYGDSVRHEQFFPFLVNVFRLFPEAQLDRLIAEAAADEASDEAIYLAVAGRLDTIKPLLGDLTYSLPSLEKQKRIMTQQTVDLLGEDRRFSGYLELGTTGRYVSALDDRIEIDGPVFMCHEKPPTFGPQDIIDRGRLRKRGDFISLAGYQADFLKQIGRAQLEFVTIFIGFHHCPLELRESFITSIRDAMKPGASLILRDHDAPDERMRRVVALAHDVFNLGTRESWDYNRAELRNFYGLDTLHAMLTRFGFSGGERRLYQSGDPTRNALMLYRRR